MRGAASSAWAWLQRLMVRWRWVLAAAYSAWIYWLSSIEYLHTRLPGRVSHYDKLGHVAVYAVLGALYFNAVTAGGGRASARRTILAFLLTVAFGASDEWHQSFVPGRSGKLGDWLADALGAALAMGLGWWLARRGAGRRE